MEIKHRFINIQINYHINMDSYKIMSIYMNMINLYNDLKYYSNFIMNYYLLIIKIINWKFF